MANVVDSFEAQLHTWMASVGFTETRCEPVTTVVKTDTAGAIAVSTERNDTHTFTASGLTVVVSVTGSY